MKSRTCPGANDKPCPTSVDISNYHGNATRCERCARKHRYHRWHIRHKAKVESGENAKARKKRSLEAQRINALRIAEALTVEAEAANPKAASKFIDFFINQPEGR